MVDGLASAAKTPDPVRYTNVSEHRAHCLCWGLTLQERLNGTPEEIVNEAVNRKAVHDLPSDHAFSSVDVGSPHARQVKNRWRCQSWIGPIPGDVKWV